MCRTVCDILKIGHLAGFFKNIPPLEVVEGSNHAAGCAPGGTAAARLFAAVFVM
jgi:hypothetical protein